MRTDFAGGFRPYYLNVDDYVNNSAYRHEEQGVSLDFFGVIYGENASNPAQYLHQIYINEGVQSIVKAEGSYTIIIHDGSKVVIIRDHHGTGEQIYYTREHFSSSLQGFLDICKVSPYVSDTALCSFLAKGYIPTGMSSIEGVKKLSAGSMLVYENGNVIEKNLFPVGNIPPAQGNFDIDHLSSSYGKLHRQAISRRIEGKNNVGILLSGGYDSGSNLCALREIYDGRISSYSVGFKGDSWSELPLARHMSEYFGTDHHEYEIDGSEIMALPDIVRELSDPFVEGGLMVNYCAMRMIGQDKPDVILGGDGSDQYFGTSAREVALHYILSKTGVKPLAELAGKMLSGKKFDKDNKYYRVRFHLNKILRILDGDLFGFEDFALKDLLADKSAFIPVKHEKTDLRSFEHLYTQHAYKGDIEKIINQVILFKASKMARMFGYEIAFPFMDGELYEFLKTVPVKYKCDSKSLFEIAKGRSISKYLLKYHYKPKLPTLITSKKKQGGFAPMPIFFADGNRRKLIADFVMSSSVCGEFLDAREVEKFIKRYDDIITDGHNWFWYRQNKAIQYFNLLTLALWWEIYVKSNKTITL